MFNGNEIGALLGWFQLQIYDEKNPGITDRRHLHFIASTVSSKMLKSIAMAENMNFEVRISDLCLVSSQF